MPGDEELSLRELLGREFGGQVEVGDRLFYVQVEFIVRSADENGIGDVGLTIEPPPAELPNFPNRRDLARILRALVPPWRRRQPKAERSPLAAS